MLEKPDARIFERALQALGVPAQFTVHVGESRKNDIVGARFAGLEAWQYGRDVHSFSDIVSRILSANGVST
jgi:FMN phosphatase YigB (HAD superfamily)